MLKLFLNAVKEALQCSPEALQKLSSVVIDYVSLLPEIHGAVLRSIKFVPFFVKIKESRPRDSFPLLWMIERQRDDYPAA